jgi:hypothetical protein
MSASSFHLFAERYLLRGFFTKLADVDLEPVAIVFEFMCPAGTIRWALGYGWAAGMDESGWRSFC